MIPKLKSAVEKVVSVSSSVKTDLWHERLIELVVANMRPSLSLEIGIAEGRVSRILAKHSVAAIGIDLDPIAIDRVKGLSNFSAYLGDSHLILNHLRLDFADQVSLAFIDGNHIAEHAFEDFKLVLPLMKNEGLILMHDTWPRDVTFTSEANEWCGSAWRLPRLIKRHFPGFEIVTLPFHPGLTLVSKGIHRLDWEI